MIEAAEPDFLLAAETAAAGALLRETAGFRAHPQVRLRLGWLHWLRYQALPQGQDEDELADALAFFVSVVGPFPESLPEAVTRMLDTEDAPDLATASTIALSLLRRAREHPDPALLDAALHFFDVARRDVGATNDDLVAVLGNVTAAQVTRFERTGDLEALDFAVEAGDEAVRLAADGSPHQSAACGNLAAALLARAQQTGERSDLDRCVEAGFQAIAVADRLGAGDLRTYRTNVASALRLRYQQTAARPDLDAAIRLGQQALSDLPDDGERPHPELAALWLSLASSLRLRFEAAADPDDLDAAVAAQRAAVQTLPEAHPTRPIAMANLGNSLRDEYLFSGDEPVLSEALQLHRAAVRLGAGHPQEATLLTNLASDLSCLYDRTGQAVDLQEAVDLMDRALSGTDISDPRYASRQSNLGSVLWTSAQRSGDRAQLERAVELLEAAAGDSGARPGLDPPALLSNLAAILMTLFEQTGQTAALHRAADLAREAVAAQSGVPPYRRLHLSTLGNVLLTIYELDGDTAFLDEAIGVLREAAQTLPPQHPDRAAFWSNLSNALRERYERYGDRDAEDEANRLLREAVEATDEHSPERATYLSNLATLLNSRFERDRPAGDAGVAVLNQAIDLDRRAAALLGDSHPDQPRVLSNLSMSLRARHDLGHDPSDLDDAVAAARQAVDQVTDDHPHRAVYLGSLGGALADRHDAYGDRGALRQAVDAYREAAEMIAARPVVRVLAARFWGGCALRADRPEEAKAAYEQAFALLVLPVVPRKLARHDRQHQLGQLGGLAADAAACALVNDDPALAVQWLERGRGILLAQQLEHRTELDDLRTQHPELADAYEDVCLALDAEPGRHADSGSGAAPPSAVLVRRRQELADRWQQIVTSIQQQPGFTDFLRPPSLTELLAEAKRGPIAMINASRHRGDALLLTGETVLHRPLPALDADIAESQVTAFLAAISDAYDDAATAEQAQAAETRIAEVLDWARRSIAAPVLDTLTRAAAPAQVERVWWSATGALAFLPLHAAIVDRAVSCYTPTVRVLRHLRRAARRPTRQQRTMLVVGTHGDGPALPGVTDEIAALQKLVPDATVFSGPTVTADAILAMLPQHAWAHFACHGVSDATDPSESRLAIHPDDASQLTVRDVAQLRLTDARLAFLSACGTARTDETVPDEAIHIAGAFQLAGYPAVVATLWPVVDDIAAAFADAFYQRLTAAGETGDVAQIVHDITVEHRAAYADAPSVWAAHIYAGS
ncbi:CHAT domain-containing tetratricopeptide repeat protein [Paractinoplanes rishiriensis]|uniref:CHAT domain-containing tetratricopeptide repeat protein n=1 Tax=Paractinoplanes rishiriensis TaxID=1050105 RepID=UPI00194373FE|nr:CHAT domain-containing protein [Actinoplanes rishiriensis]